VPTVTRLTTKHRTTIPAEVRRALGLRAGEQVEFRVDGSTVTLRKAEPGLSEDLVLRLIQAHAMRNWHTPEDDEAFRTFRRWDVVSVPFPFVGGHAAKRCPALAVSTDAFDRAHPPA
jgi:AbrB family looped-hinge helix DNA binding protein